MSIITTRAQRRQLERENARRPLRLEIVPRDQWPIDLTGRRGAPTTVWRSRDFLVQQFEAPAPAVCRLSILRTSLQGDRWTDGITWDDLQRLKAEAGYADAWAVELFPADLDVVNVANIRHLWLLPCAPEFAWTRLHTRARTSQQVLKAEGDGPDATDRDCSANASPDGGPMGSEQPAAAGLDQGANAA